MRFVSHREGSEGGVWARVVHDPPAAVVAAFGEPVFGGDHDAAPLHREALDLGGGPAADQRHVGHCAGVLRVAGAGVDHVAALDYGKKSTENKFDVFVCLIHWNKETDVCMPRRAQFALGGEVLFGLCRPFVYLARTFVRDAPWRRNVSVFLKRAAGRQKNGDSFWFWRNGHNPSGLVVNK